jgi:hypothetical protein
MIAHAFFGHKVDSVKVGENFGCTNLPKQKVNPYQFIIASCGGKAAVDRWYGWKSKSDENWRASDDYKKSLKVALWLNEGDTLAAEALLKWGERVADTIIEKHWDQFPGIVEALVERGKSKVYYTMRR